MELLGQEVCGRRLAGSDLSPHWLNMVEDDCWYGEGRLIIKKVYKRFPVAYIHWLRKEIRCLQSLKTKEKNGIKTPSGRKPSLLKLKYQFILIKLFAYPPVVEKVSKRVEMLFLHLTYQVVG